MVANYSLDDVTPTGRSGLRVDVYSSQLMRRYLKDNDAHDDACDPDSARGLYKPRGCAPIVRVRTTRKHKDGC